MRYQILRMCRNGEWDVEGQSDTDSEALSLAKAWARHMPKCQYGVKVVDSYTEETIYEN